MPPLIMVPSNVPPDAAVYQPIESPADIALRFDVVPGQTEAGVAVTETATEGTLFIVISVGSGPLSVAGLLDITLIL